MSHNQSRGSDDRSESTESHVDPEPPVPERPPLAETPGGNRLHAHQLVAIDKNYHTQFHYYVVDYDSASRRVQLREAGSHDFTRTLPIERFADDDVHVITTDDGTPVWGY
jgi:hypothetical protein